MRLLCIAGHNTGSVQYRDCCQNQHASDECVREVIMHSERSGYGLSAFYQVGDSWSNLGCPGLFPARLTEESKRLHSERG